MAEELLLDWAVEESNKNSKLIIIRPTAVFGNKIEEISLDYLKQAHQKNLFFQEKGTL